jgi:tRNA-specific 2-thiouridylase
LSEKSKESIESGPIIDREGNVLGRHQGIPYYTIGQRRGLRLSRGKPLYVIRIDRKKNEIVVGGEEEVYGDTLIVDSVNWIIPHEMIPSHPIQVKIRYNHPGSEASLFQRGEGEWGMKFKSPQKAITPGQAAVFYDGETVLGGGWIKEVRSSE